MHRHTGPAPGIMVWGGIEFHCRTTLVHFAGTLNSQRYTLRYWSPRSSHAFSACHQPYSNRIMRDYTWHAMFKSSSLPIRLNSFLGQLVLPIYHQSKHVFHACTMTGQVYISHYYTRRQYVEAAWRLLCPKDRSRASLVLCRGV
ncbi:hypothetical protein TNCV_1767541 [Trichonephila clavipes]|nr:hypothetical protein TNCV_1767541 [Trichonephila clavipes]